MSSHRQWRGWLALHLPEEGVHGLVPVAVSRDYALEIPPGPDELTRAATELQRQWLDDGGLVVAATARLPANGLMIVRPHLECWCDGRVLAPEEVEALSPTTGAGSRPRVFVAKYPEIELNDGHSQRDPGPEAIDS